MRITTSHAAEARTSRRTLPRFVFSVYALTLILQIAAHGALAETPLDRLIKLDITANTPLEDALIEWGNKAGVTVMINTETVSHRLANKVIGTLSARQALSLLLRNSGLSYTEDGGRVRVIEATQLVPSGFESLESPTGVSAHSDFEASSPDHSDSSASTSSDSSSHGMAEVIVTAQKRAEREQDVPASLDILSSDQLEKQGANQLSDYAKQVPGLTLIASTGPGQGKVVLRGVSTGGGAPLVGIYLDDVPFTPSSPNSLSNGVMLDPDLADIDHIEVLDGPQSTLYGASSMGGVIKYITKQPDPSHFEGNVRIAGSQVDGGGFGYGLRASINVPLISDTAAIRGSLFYRDDPGFVDNLGLGEKNVNHDSVKGGRLALLVKVGDNVETVLEGLVQNIDTAGLNYIYVDSKTLQRLTPGLSYSSQLPLPITIKHESVSDTTTANFGFATLTNIISYAHLVGNVTTDISAYGGFVGMPAGDLVKSGGPTASQRISDEIRLTSSPGQWEWLIGGFYTHEHDPDNVDLVGLDPSARPLPSSDPFFNFYSYTNTSVFKEHAVFGDLTYHITDEVGATVGARYSSNRQSFSYSATGIFAGPSGVGGAGDSNDSATTYLGTVTYKPASTVTLYARAASAYRPGGPNILAPTEIAAGAQTTFKPDKLWNYESGIKGSLFDQKMSYAVDIYHMNWTDIQLNVLVAGFTVVANATSARSNGAEASFQFFPVAGLSLGVNGSYTDAKLTGPIGPPIGAGSGSRLPYTPIVSGAVLIDYRKGSLLGAVPTAGATFAYRGASQTSFAANTGAIALHSYSTLDLRGGLEWPRYSVLMTVQNVTNRFALTNASQTAAFGSPTAATVLPPRTYGIQALARF